MSSSRSRILAVLFLFACALTVTAQETGHTAEDQRRRTCCGDDDRAQERRAFAHGWRSDANQTLASGERPSAYSCFSDAGSGTTTCRFTEASGCRL